MLRFFRYVLELIAGIVAVTIALALVMAWRLSSSPITSDFMTPTIEAGIESLIPNSTVHLGKILWTWDAARREVSLHADGIRVTDGKDSEIAVIPSFDARISAIGMIFGQFMPEDLTITHPQIKLIHDRKGRFVFAGMTMGEKDDKIQNEATADNALRDSVAHLSHAALMHELSVTQAVFDVQDEATQQDWSIAVPEISITRRAVSSIGNRVEWGSLEGHLAVEVTQKDATATLHLDYAYDPDRQQHRLATVFEDVTPAFFAGGHPETLGLNAAAIVDLPLSGKVAATFDRNFSVDALAAQIHGDEGRLIYPAFWNEPCAVKFFDVNVMYDRAARTLAVSDSKIDFVGPVLGINITGKPPTQAGQDMAFTASVMIDNVPMNRFDALWPKILLSDPRDWMAAHLHDGVYTHGEVSLQGGLVWNDLAHIDIRDGGGKVEAVKGRVIYMDGLPPVENASADATFDLNKMDILLADGHIGAIKISPFTAHIKGLSDADQTIEIPLQVSGPVPEILQLLDHQPLGYAKKLGVAPNDLEGQASGTVLFKFPLLKDLAMKDMDIAATATATDIASTHLVPGIAIDQGRFDMTVDVNGFAFKGSVALDKIPFQLDWQEAFAPAPDRPLSRMTLVGAIKDDQWKNFGIDLFNGSKGAMTVNMTLTRPDKMTTLFSGTVDMTAAALVVPLLNWKKAANVPALLTFAAQQTGNKNINVTSVHLQGDHASAVGDAVMSPDGGHLLALNLAPLAVGRSHAALHLTQSYGDDGAVKAEISGTSFDMTGFNHSSSGAEDRRSKNITVRVDKLYTSDSGKIDKARIAAVRDHQGWQLLSVHGLADGDAPLAIDLEPQSDGHSLFTMTCDNFGKMMKGLGLTDRIKGGKFSLLGASTVDHPRLVIGKMKITDFTAQKLPVLALLLNAASPFGFAGILTDSTDFSRFDGDMQWQGDDITLMKAHGVGSAVGINIDGKINVNSGDANLAGTVVPFSVINSALNTIPLIGDLITGGKDQGVLAVSYQLTGNLNKPDISVNPVSLLTPGFIRNLFFTDDAIDEPIPPSTQEDEKE